MIQLPNGCRCSELTVTPSNWRTKRASVSKDWYISYRFYDPKFPKPKQRLIKGMNDYKKLEERQVATKGILEDELHLLIECQFNPITGEIKEPAEEQYGEIRPDMPFIPALETAVKMMDVDTNTRKDLRSILKYFAKAAELVRKDYVLLGEIKRKDIRLVLNNLEKVKAQEKRKWSNNQWNHYRSHLSMIYSYLNREEIVEYNPIDKIEKKSVIRAPRQILSEEQRITIDQHLKTKTPEFHRYVHIFFHSGARGAELLRLQGSHVDLPGQRYRLLIKKRKVKVWEWKTIKDIALPYWQDAMKNCGPDDYVFSEGLVPGPKAIRPEQVTRRWRRHVKASLQKGGLGINVDIYALKHLHTTEIMDLLENDNSALQEIAEHNSHTSGAMVVQIYDVRQKARHHKKIKGIGNPFA